MILLRTIILCWVFSCELCFGNQLFEQDIVAREEASPDGDEKYLTADACPNRGVSIETSSETSTALNNFMCCGESGECKRHANICSAWRRDKMTLSNASQACNALGLHLCSENELANGICCNKGCGVNSRKVWTVERSGSNPTSDGEKFFAADACPNLGAQIETALEPASNINNVLCCTASGRCVKHTNQCSNWRKEILSHASAAHKCQALGYRLCSKNELLSRRCCNKGCGANSKKVWTSDSQSDVFYYAADACPTIGLSPLTSLESSSSPNNVICCDSAGGCNRYTSQCEDWQKGQLSHSNATQTCQLMGKRLCSKSELLDGLCCNKGCNSNSYKVWTSDSHSATTYYVDGIRGKDEYDGLSLRTAFKTIQKCVDVSLSMDSCLIRKGRYHEEVTISQKANLTISGYEKEKVVMDGTVVLKPEEGIWSFDTDGICSGTINVDVYQLFLDEDMMTNARWPNAVWKENKDKERTVFDEAYWGHSDSASTPGMMVDREGILGSSNLDMTGAMAVLNTGSWATFVKPVTSHTQGSNTFEYVDDFADNAAYHFKAGNNRYYLDSKRNLLDNPGEWHFDQITKVLSFMPYDGSCPDPSSNRVRGRTLDYAMTVTDTVDLTVANITFFASAFIANSENILSQDIRLNSINFKFSSSSKRMLGKIDVPGWTQLNSKLLQDFGYIEVINCVFFGGEGAALSYKGLRPLIHNNAFLWNDWTGQLSLNLHGGLGTVFSNSQGEELSQNTFENNGCMHSFNPYASTKPNATLNRIKGTCKGNIQNDGAALHFQIKPQTDGTMRRNWVYDTPKMGFRTDAATVHPNMNLGEKTTIQENVVWDAGRGFMIKGDNHTITGNLALQNQGREEEGCSLCVIMYMRNYNYNGEKVLSPLMNNNSLVENNAAWLANGGPRPGWSPYNGGVWPMPVGAINTFSNDSVRDLLVDVDNFDFRPKVDTALTNKDSTFSGPYSPDIGSKNETDHLSHYWIPGRKLMKASFPIPRNGAKLDKMRDVLMCQTGYRSSQHDFFFGNKRAAVQKADVHSEEFRGTFVNGQNVFAISESFMDSKSGGTFFWRVDATNEYGHVFKGNVWKFKVAN